MIGRGEGDCCGWIRGSIFASVSCQMSLALYTMITTCMCVEEGVFDGWVSY